MNSNKLKILFVIRANRTNKENKCPLNIRITYKKERRQFSSGLTVDKSLWNATNQRLEDQSVEGQAFNNDLILIKHKIQNLYLALKIQDQKFSVDEILALYQDKPIKRTENTGIIENFDIFLKNQERLIGKDIKEVTWKKFNYVLNDLKHFVKVVLAKKDVPLKELNQSFLNQFQYYLKTDKNQKQVTVNKAIQRLRKPIQVALGEGLITSDPFGRHKPGKVFKEVVFLSEDELRRLENHTFLSRRLERVKNLFIFCCYTGLAYREMASLKPEHIVNGFDGGQWIKMKREKTGKDIAVPLLPQAKDIVDKYSGQCETIFTPLSNQKFNSYLKEIAEKLEIKKRMTHHTARKTFASTVLLYNEVPIEIVSELLGHSSIKITQDYYGKIVNKTLSITMNNLSEKLAKKHG
ncbi:site-specific integrase [Leeuwenhoekiella parthenopeia]|uniref:Site-specific integrase n=1 Tax=Leeuwenhoekiella parthenopeia TaxID=2890320 RepID=A0ABS8GRX3_9FLAO|nr:site-specific integrase [Leeuwenhoekiella parthenopeia]MCC4211328.1 site-specific integrase [Leeuwenhoekiella parthenopeia]